MELKSNPLEGKIAEAVFDSGAHYRLEYLPNNRMRWSNLLPGKESDAEVDTIHVVKLNDGIFAVDWVESTGIAVSHSININNATIYGFLSVKDSYAYGGRATAAYSGTYKFITVKDKEDNAPFTNRQIVTDFWEGFFNRHDVDYADKYLAALYTQHNPEFADGLKAFKEVFIPLFKGAYRDFSAEIIRTAAEDDLVYLHNHKKLNAEDPGSAALDIFRVTDGKITEHWDIIQPIPTKAANPHPMF